MQHRLITEDRSVIVALDASGAGKNREVVRATSGIDGISGYKVGFGLAYLGLSHMVATLRGECETPKKIILDPQKAGTDIPETGALFAKTVKDADVDAVILFPLAGSATQHDWTNYCQDLGIRVIVGLAMTHKQFFVSEGGYIADDAPERAFRLACQQGVRDFVVPGTKIGWVTKLRKVLVDEIGDGNFALYAPGFVSQGGDISECGLAAGRIFHAIVGSAIYKHQSVGEIEEAAKLSTSKLAA